MSTIGESFPKIVTGEAIEGMENMPRPAAPFYFVGLLIAVVMMARIAQLFTGI